MPPSILPWYITSRLQAVLYFAKNKDLTNDSSHSIPQHRTPSERWVNDWTRSQHHMPLRSFVPSAPHDLNSVGLAVNGSLVNGSAMSGSAYWSWASCRVLSPTRHALRPYVGLERMEARRTCTHGKIDGTIVKKRLFAPRATAMLAYGVNCARWSRRRITGYSGRKSGARQSGCSRTWRGRRVTKLTLISVQKFAEG